jgi:phospholipase/carboxylesterase
MPEDREPHYLESIEIETASGPTGSVIWMHGLGADGGDFAPVLPALGLTPGLALRFIFPHAPMRPVSINAGFVMRAWYDVRHPDLSQMEDDAGLQESERAVVALIHRERSRGVPPGRVVLAGFSQGGALALHTGLRHGERLAGILALSTYLPLSDRVEQERHRANAGVPVFMGHGVADPVVPFVLGASSRERLAALGYPVQWHQYPLPHSVSWDEIADVGRWLSAVLA